jgi:outer membrane protein assembly factor BamA
MLYRSALIVCLSYIVSCAAAQPDGDAKQKRLAILPIISFTPETSLILGVGGFYFIQPSDSVTRLSFANAGALASLNRQWQVSLAVNYFTQAEKWYVQSTLSYNDFPLFFYGIGPTIDIDNREMVSSNNFRFQALLYRQLARKFFAGAGYRYGNVHRLDFGQNGILEALAPTGLMGNYYSGIQACLLVDSRDNQLTSAQGWYINATYFYHHRYLGSEYDFGNTQVDVRHYLKVIERRGDVLAFQLHGSFNHGNVPFTELALVGGDNLMRGYYLGKYRDMNYVAAQAEYRYPLNDWIGLAAFAGIGTLAPTVRALSESIVLPSYGGGLRIKINKKENINLRIDYGRGRDTGNFYFAISEAF